MGSRNNRDPRTQAQTPDPENSVEFCVKVSSTGGCVCGRWARMFIVF